MNRTRFSSIHGPDLGMGIHPVEGWGVAERDPRPRWRGEVRRSARVRARRLAKRHARARGMTLKAYLRQHGGEA
jgi:hypothetical protein